LRQAVLFSARVTRFLLFAGTQRHSELFQGDQDPAKVLHRLELSQSAQCSNFDTVLDAMDKLPLFEEDAHS